MRIVIAPDSFKESASAKHVAQAMAAGIRRALPDAELLQVPMADGGEGTVDALVAATRGRKVPFEAADPLGRPVTAALHADEVRKLDRAGVSKSEIARRLRIGRTSVRRILTSKRA